MEKTAVTALDLNFRNHKKTIASYFVRHSTGAVLVECGPTSTLPALQSELALRGLGPKDVTHVLLTHIHLDHAGAAGWWARQGAEIYVHPIGAPHLLDPERLLASAKRIYGEEMESLWGEVLPVPEDKLRMAEDGEEVAIGGLRFLPLSTPGHAEHHHAYLFEDLCFSGDIGGIRLPGYQYLRLPMPPPELFLERWEESVAKLRKAAFARIAPTHFGIYEDAGWHLDQLEKELIETNRWVQNCMATEPDENEFLKAYSEWMHADGETKSIPDAIMDIYDVTNPPYMSAMGLRRYWMKVRKAH